MINPLARVVMRNVSKGAKKTREDRIDKIPNEASYVTLSSLTNKKSSLEKGSSNPPRETIGSQGNRGPSKRENISRHYSSNRNLENRVGNRSYNRPYEKTDNLTENDKELIRRLIHKEKKVEVGSKAGNRLTLGEAANRIRGRK